MRLLLAALAVLLAGAAAAAPDPVIGDVRAISSDKAHLDGCVLMICPSQTWTRANPK